MSLSRIGKLPIAIPSGVTITVDSGNVTVEGPKGKLVQFITPAVNVKVNDGVFTVEPKDESKEARAQHGLMRALVNNMVTGVTKGFEKRLEVKGVGFRVNAANNVLDMSLGFSHPVQYKAPEGVTITNEKMIIIVAGIDKQKVGQTAAEIRAIKKPEPYKGKGIMYVDEQILRKAGKTGKK
jgi:large subunit ribosomal protein L6